MTADRPEVERAADAEADPLLERLRALVDEARRTGRLEDLRDAWGAALRATPDSTADAGADPDDAPVPMQHGMVGDSPEMRELFALIDRVAPSHVAVLIQGETGTGKELVARALHAGSKRAAKPFLAENCAAVPAELLESELFGHKKGSFTGAVVDRPGHFVAADGGTLFLDEIGDMPLPMQAKLLRVLQDGEVRPVGSNKSQKVDVRVVAATHRDLPEACRSGAFREDLYFRLAVITLRLPALRERPSDIPHLARFFLGRAARELGREAELTPAALAALEAWTWPGNVRELENELLRAVALGGGRIDVGDLSPAIQAGV